MSLRFFLLFELMFFAVCDLIYLPLSALNRSVVCDCDISRSKPLIYLAVPFHLNLIPSFKSICDAEIKSKKLVSAHLRHYDKLFVMVINFFFTVT